MSLKAKAEVNQREILALPADCQTLLSKAQVAAALSLSVRKVEEMISAAEFPKPDLRITGNLPRWRVGTLNAWIDAQSSKRN
ncbi:helix-turn-helix transcriptional regulator [Singulisphaera acidiphila]|uniref:Putative transcriptional regulator n=1 Tax=Singulisphaera acidiphila (strain ATCC BAA-1392 / DSM 18658 / VKM B-2454 / MOB10) TaxID=886293 RepID=L0DIR1_SINAD|nr:transcriptional regulator [Singulisphaera acidiphila]AGA28740.1 putative transcriptional regulator [Singulisphaera acidiphila DSM 18658]